MSSEKTVLYESLKSIFLHIDNHEKAFLSQFNLTIPRFFTLVHLRKNPTISPLALADLLLCTKSNVSRIVQGMLDDGLIDRQDHPTDKRSFQLSLTPSGDALLDEVYPAYEKLVNDLMSSFNPEQLALYTEVSQHIESTLAPNGTGTLTNTQASLGPVARSWRLR
jgi:DNA-binding MarR family transcriptional regulator